MQKIQRDEKMNQQIKFTVRVVRQDLEGADMPRLYPLDNSAKRYAGVGRGGSAIHWAKVSRDFKDGDILQVNLTKVGNQPEIMDAEQIKASRKR